MVSQVKNTLGLSLIKLDGAEVAIRRHVREVSEWITVTRPGS